MIALLLLGAANAAWQETPEDRLDQLLQAFEGRPEADVDALAAEIDALGAAVLEPAARRLAQDLRDGVALLAAPALVDVLAARRAGVAQLRAALVDPGTPPAGRVRIARALADLGDAESWRPALREILSDRALPLEDRLSAAGVLLEAGDGPALRPLGELAAGAPARPPGRATPDLRFPVARPHARDPDPPRRGPGVSRRRRPRRAARARRGRAPAPAPVRRPRVGPEEKRRRRRALDYNGRGRGRRGRPRPPGPVLAAPAERLT